MQDNNQPMQLGRRAFLKGSTLLLATTATIDRLMMGATPLFAQEQAPKLRIGMITDLHYADKPVAGNRYYRESLSKLAEVAKQFQADKPSFLVELGDLIDAADSPETEERYLKTINGAFAPICKDRHYVLGNHCVETLKKEEFLGIVEQEKSYYSFDQQGFHFVVLDSCFRADGEPYGRKNFTWTDSNIPEAELKWLQKDLEKTDKQTVVFAHQRLDVSTSHGVKNNAEVRKILEASGKVLAVFQGHNHKNDLKEIGGIHYCTLVAMVEGSGAENSGYSLIDIDSNGTIQLSGFRKQQNYTWKQ